MAITQDMLAEESIFSRAERSVARGVYRAYRLTEVVKYLDTCDEALIMWTNRQREADHSPNAKAHRKEIKDYLLNRIRDTLDNTKVPQTNTALEKLATPAQ